jgi:hypothetical protein
MLHIKLKHDKVWIKKLISTNNASKKEQREKLIPLRL